MAAWNKKMRGITAIVAGLFIATAAMATMWHDRRDERQVDPAEQPGAIPSAGTDYQDSSSSPGQTGLQGNSGEPIRLTSGAAGGSLTYNQALALFGSARVRFDGDCRITPQSLSVGNDATLLFDNRSRDARAFSLDGVDYILPGYGFKLLKLSAPRLPHAVGVTCDKNSAVITLQG